MALAGWLGWAGLASTDLAGLLVLFSVGSWRVSGPPLDRLPSILGAFWAPPGGPGVSSGEQNRQFRRKSRARVSFVSRLLRRSCKFGENVKIVVLLKREHHFQGPRSTQNGPLGAPGRPK
jgi:hypothetical protein